MKHPTRVREYKPNLWRDVGPTSLVDSSGVVLSIQYTGRVFDFLVEICDYLYCLRIRPSEMQRKKNSFESSHMYNR